jgi:hypothetical protein
MRKIRYWTLSTSTLPVGDVTDFDMMGYSQSKLTVDLCVNVGSTRISPRQSPQGRVVLLRGVQRARQDLTIGYVLQSTDPLD